MAAAAGEPAAQSDRRSSSTAADAAGLRNAGSHSPPQSRGEPSGEVSSTSSLRRSQAEQLKLKLKLERLELERLERERERQQELEREQEEGATGRHGSLRSKSSGNGSSVDSGDGARDAGYRRHQQRREGRRNRSSSRSGDGGSSK